MTTERILLITSAITCIAVWVPIIIDAIRNRNNGSKN